MFYPQANRSDKLDKESKILLYLFGIILIISADWSGFIHGSVTKSTFIYTDEKSSRMENETIS